MASPASTASRPSEATPDSASSTTATNSRPAVEVTAVTSRDDLLLELGEALSGQASVHPVESMGEALPHLSGGKRAHVLVIDTRDITDIRTEVQRVDAAAPQAIVLVLAAADSEKEVAGAVKGSKVFAVLPIPLDKRKSAAVLDAAVAEARDRKAARSGESAQGAEHSHAPASGLAHSHGSAHSSVTQAHGLDQAMAVSVEPFRPHSRSDSLSDGDWKARLPLIAGAVIAVLALAAGGYFLFGRSSNQAVPHPAAAKNTPASAAAPAAGNKAAEETLAAPTVETSLVQGKVDELLEKARQAMRERRYSEPAGDNALLYYRSAAAADPANGEAGDGLQRVAGVLSNRFEDAMSGGRFDEAGQALANLKLATPKDSSLAQLELRLTTAQVAKALADGNPDRAAALVRQAQQSNAVPADQITRWRADISRRQEEGKIQRLATLVSDRTRDGKLIDPAGDSARDYLQQLREQAPSNSTTQRLMHELNGAFLRKAREASLANRSAESDRWLSEAKAGGATAAEIGAYQRDLTGARQRAAAAESERLGQLVRDRLREGRLTDPAQDSAAFYLGQLQASDGSSAGSAVLARELAGKLLDRARSSAQSGRPVDADLAQAKHFGADPKDILAVQQIQSAPRGAAGGAQRSPADLAALAANMKRLRYVAPEYPQKALQLNATGAVTVEYTVDVKGDTRDVHVVESSPPGMFDRSAIAAIKRWHYQPAVVDGTPVEVPIRTAIRFELPK
ncbi:MAG TPA: energy transducer TonB [Steroidobacteraceae bacterium]|nr:energy transducer TonB [Steroidobacteraceae bacterium]